MTTNTLSLRLNGALCLGPDGLAQRDFGIADGLIECAADGRPVDLRGYWVLPAFVDVHGDGFERHLAPRRGAMKDLAQGLMSADAELASNGIATATLAQFYSWEGGMRSPAFALRFLETLRECRAQLLTDVLVQLRFETQMLEDYDAVAQLVADFAVPYLVLNDHIPHDALAKGKRPPRLTGQALKSGRSPDAHLELLKQMHGRSAEVAPALATFAEKLRSRGVRLGSHDDATADQRCWFHALGVEISEFPETREAAETAKLEGGKVILGAPNVVRGGSHSGNASAQDLIAAGLCDALASDYHYPALKQAVFRLVDEGVLPLQKAWELVSRGPAQLLGYADRGTLAQGQRADLVILDPTSRRIEATMTAGRFSYLAGGVAQRFLG